MCFSRDWSYQNILKVIPVTETESYRLSKAVVMITPCSLYSTVISDPSSSLPEADGTPIEVKARALNL